MPLLGVRLQPFRRRRGSATGPLGKVPSPPGIRACSPKGWVPIQDQFPNPPAPSPSYLIDREEDWVLRAVLVGILREDERMGPS